MPLINRGASILTVGDRNNPHNTAHIYYGDANTCAEVALDVDQLPGTPPAGIGSWYLSCGHGSRAIGAMFFKVTLGSTLPDWLQIVVLPCGGPPIP